MKYKAVIFDLDGVLCSTDQYHYAAWKKVANELGLHFDREMNERLRGVSRMESFDIILEENGKDLSEAEKAYSIRRKNTYYVDFIQEMSAADVDKAVRPMLRKLRDSGVKTAIGSSSRNAKLILRKTGLCDCFDAVSDGTNIRQSKPDPEVFLKASQYLDVDPEDCIVVEDARAGIDAAVAAGMDSAAIGSAEGYAAATYNLDALPDLLKVVA